MSVLYYVFVYNLLVLTFLLPSAGIETVTDAEHNPPTPPTLPYCMPVLTSGNNNSQNFNSQKKSNNNFCEKPKPKPIIPNHETIILNHFKKQPQVKCKDLSRSGNLKEDSNHVKIFDDQATLPSLTLKEVVATDSSLDDDLFSVSDSPNIKTNEVLNNSFCEKVQELRKLGIDDNSTHTLFPVNIDDPRLPVDNLMLPVSAFFIF